MVIQSSKSNFTFTLHTSKGLLVDLLSYVDHLGTPALFAMLPLQNRKGQTHGLLMFQAGNEATLCSLTLCWPKQAKCHPEGKYDLAMHLEETMCTPIYTLYPNILNCINDSLVLLKLNHFHITDLIFPFMPVSIGQMNLIFLFLPLSLLWTYPYASSVGFIKRHQACFHILSTEKGYLSWNTPRCYLVCVIYYLHLQCHQADPKAPILALHLHMGAMFSRLCLSLFTITR